MNPVILSVILPSVSDCGKLDRFCTALFSSDLNAELIICENEETMQKLTIGEKYSDEIRLIKTDNNSNAFSDAVRKAKGRFVVFSDVNTVYAPHAFEAMIVAGKGGACVSDTAVLNEGEASKLYSENYLFEDTAAFPVYGNFLMQNEVISKAGIVPQGRDALSIMIFIADYSRYDSFYLINDVLSYSDAKLSCEGVNCDILKKRAEDFAYGTDYHSKLFYITVAVSALTDNIDEKKLEVLKSIAELFYEDYPVASWARARFSIDLYSTAKEDITPEEFQKEIKCLWYKEIKAPLEAEDVIKSFCYGKLGAGVLKRCIAAWCYYKFYRRKDGFIKRTGCSICRKLLGGDIGV